MEVKSLKKYFKDMDIARGIGIFLVVLGHSFPDGKFNNNPIYIYIFKLIYSFHMPLFFMISGFFAYKVYKISSLSEYREFVANKFSRLMIPYFSIAILAIPIKLFMNKYAVRPVQIQSLFIDMIFYPLNIPIQYFWFIYVLFFIFAVAPLFNKIPIKMILLITLVLNLFPIKQIQIFYVYGIIHYLFYFYLGIYFYTVYGKYNSFKYKNIVVMVSLFLLILLNFVEPTKQMYNFHRLATSLIGSALFINLAYLIVNNKIGEMFKFIGKYSYDIYLFSWFFQTGVRVILFQILKCDYTLVTLVMIVVGFFPIVLSQVFLNRIPILNTIFLGKKYKPAINKK